MAKTTSYRPVVLIALVVLFVAVAACLFVYKSRTLAGHNCANLAGWGTGPKVATSQAGTTMTGATAEPSRCFDRLVINLGSENVHYNVHYATTVPAQGSGNDLTLSGGAKLAIDLSAAAYDADAGTPLYAATVNQTLPGQDLTGYRTFRDLKWGGSFEGQSTIGLGLRDRLPYRVLNLGNQLIIDVAHR